MPTSNAATPLGLTCAHDRHAGFGADVSRITVHGQGGGVDFRLDRFLLA